MMGRRPLVLGCALGLALSALSAHGGALEDFQTAIVRDNDRAIVTAIMALANSLRLQVIAEGVETCAQFEALTALNCDFAQGYFMAKPMPAEQIVLNAVVEPLR